MQNKKIMLCAISNISSGNCSEDCKYCTQSGYYKTGIDKFAKKDIDLILKEAKAAKQNLALGFCLVTSGRGLDDKKLEFVCTALRAVKKEVPNLMLIACNGTASLEQLKELKKAGADSYNHNLETSREFYSNICSTHEWDERFETNLNAKQADLMLCCGGIYGLGESEKDRLSLLKSLRELKPFSSPINFFIPHQELPLRKESISVNEAFDIIKLVRKELPDVRLMLAGGREAILKDKQYEIFNYGIDAIVIGDYLTAKGEMASKDLENLKNLGYEIESNCH